MKWGIQSRFCPNCGCPLRDTKVTMKFVQSLMCGEACRADWERKYAAKILGHDEEERK